MIASLSWILSSIVADDGFYRGDNRRHLPHAYDRRMQRRMTFLLQALRFYSRDHGGSLTPLRDSQSMELALSPYLRVSKSDARNPSTGQIIEPNRAFCPRLWQQVPHPEQNIAFFDSPPPPPGAPYVYFVTFAGKVDRVALEKWAQFRASHGVK